MQSSTVSRVLSPNRILVNEEESNREIVLPGTAVQYCTKYEFLSWAQNIVGKNVAYSQNRPYVQMGNEWISLSELLVRNGYLYDPEFKDAQELSVAERRGEWACASKHAIIQLVIPDPGLAKVVGAIALVESSFKGYPWPWTLNVNGQSLFFATREEAYKKILELLRAGITNFDIGITQISWKFHSGLFESPWQALQPSTNILASKKILVQLYGQLGNWTAAVKCYHDCVNPARGGQYLQAFTVKYNEIENLKR
ncbi:lysozyme family protein [Undibacterium oligocarboniphilum]|uniref:Transglycosylase SLT domain-containing protein n=1 Tax=Undibacterium oligocarboniphilum TaxID=666702 RepID=A0A850QSG9_9BURK|nr:hypothetical protein [Undibacterium oligocarboniphilum]MBC3871438.1 hypothetical protein [Undibacterium oligocarboniphilum]NVO78986.1 hypothetical protein [Undibacterium oligocarboniphilum]